MRPVSMCRHKWVTVELVAGTSRSAAMAARAIAAGKQTSKVRIASPLGQIDPPFTARIPATAVAPGFAHPVIAPCLAEGDCGCPRAGGHTVQGVAPQTGL